jgi:Domain of unknown function (DUF4149)
VIQLLRFLGVANAGGWLGAAVFVTFFSGPAFFSAGMIDALKHKYYAGLAAQVILGRYFIFHYLCAAVALAHLLAEWLYLGRKLSRLTLGLWAGLTALLLLGGVGLQPKLHQLHQAMYLGNNAAAQAEAAKTFYFWHGLSQTANLLVLAGLLVFFWRILFAAPDAPRAGGYWKFRS